MTDLSFAHFTKDLCTTERAPTTTSGFETYLESLKCTPKVPVDAETRTRLMINTPVTLWEIHLQGNPDILQGDRLRLHSEQDVTKRYSIKTVEPYTWLPTNDNRKRVIFEDETNP